MAINSTQCSLKQIHKHLNGESRETPTVQLQSTMLIHIYPLIQFPIIMYLQISMMKMLIHS